MVLIQNKKMIPIKTHTILGTFLIAISFLDVYMEEVKKKLPMRMTFKELSCITGMSYSCLREEIGSNENLMCRLTDLGWRARRRIKKAHILAIFEVIGYPDGYEWYEKEQTK